MAICPVRFLLFIRPVGHCRPKPLSAPRSRYSSAAGAECNLRATRVRQTRAGWASRSRRSCRTAVEVDAAVIEAGRLPTVGRQLGPSFLEREISEGQRADLRRCHRWQVASIADGTGIWDGMRWDDSGSGSGAGRGQLSLHGISLCCRLLKSMHLAVSSTEDP